MPGWWLRCILELIPVPARHRKEATLPNNNYLCYSNSENGPGVWDYDLSTQLAAKLLMIDPTAGSQLPDPDG
jgi:hypothetical protein